VLRVLKFPFVLAAAAIALSLPVWAQNLDFTGSITSVTPQTAVSGKLATRTEVMADRSESAMLTLGSLAALESAIAMYEEIVAGGVDYATLSRGARQRHAELFSDATMAVGVNEVYRQVLSANR